MGFGNVIFPELHDWAFATISCAILLIVSTVLFLIVKLVHHRNLRWQMVIFLFVIGISVWSLISGLNGYQEWVDIVHHAPVHGFVAYVRAINDLYLADVFRCQIQFGVTAILLVALLCWVILPRFLHRVGGATFETSLR